MGHYKEQLNKFKAANFRIWEVLCAEEVDLRLPDLTDDQFESITDFVYDWVMNTDILPAELLAHIATGLSNKEFTLEDFDTFEGQVEITKILNSYI